MAIFSKLNQVREMRKEAKKMKNTLGDEKVTVGTWNDQVKITMDGNQEIQNVEIADSALQNKSKLEDAIGEAFGKAVKKIQKIMAQKVRSGKIDMSKFQQ